MAFVMETPGVFCEEHSNPLTHLRRKLPHSPDEPAPPEARAEAVCVLASDWLPSSSTVGPRGL
jgi:hypothetical protein